VHYPQLHGFRVLVPNAQACSRTPVILVTTERV
jgi:hypothetical protein